MGHLHRMADGKSASADTAERTVAILKLTGRNEEKDEPRTIGEAIHAVFADCSEAGSDGDLEDTDPVVLRALDGWLSLDDALAELPTGARDELCISALSQALDDIEKLSAQVRARLTVEQIQNLLDAAISTAKMVGDGELERARAAKLTEQSNMDVELALRAENESLW